MRQPTENKSGHTKTKKKTQTQVEPKICQAMMMKGRRCKSFVCSHSTKYCKSHIRSDGEIDELKILRLLFRNRDKQEIEDKENKR